MQLKKKLEGLRAEENIWNTERQMEGERQKQVAFGNKI